MLVVLGSPSLSFFIPRQHKIIFPSTTSSSLSTSSSPSSSPPPTGYGIALTPGSWASK
jgi:hypothetical protein